MLGSKKQNSNTFMRREVKKMNSMKPVVIYSLGNCSVMLWVMEWNGNKYWGVTDEKLGKVTGCTSFAHASSILDGCIERLKDFVN